MSQFFENLKQKGYSGCFYQNGELWGFQETGVIPVPIPKDVIQASECESSRERLTERLKHWCDHRGISRPQIFS